jgi:hypothetical protein
MLAGYIVITERKILPKRRKFDGLATMQVPVVYRYLP